MATLEVLGRSQLDGVSADVTSLSADVRKLGTDVASVDDDARQAGAGLDTLGAAGDDVASKSSKATGALGALAGGLDAVGATGAAGALQGVAIATDVASGAGDALNLVSETTVGRFVAQTAASVAHRAATIAGTAATGAMTAAQTVLNTVMAANPIALVVIALAALAAGLVLAYKHSETFRDIVDGAFSLARDVVEGAADAVESFIGFTRDLPGEARAAWEDVKQAIKDKVDDAVGFVTGLYDDVVNGANSLKDTVAGAFETAFAPIQTAIGWVEDLVDKIGDIDFPDFPDINPFGRTVTTGTRPGDTGVSSEPTPAAPTASITVNGALDPLAVAAQIAALLTQAGFVLTGPTPWNLVPA